MSKITERYKTRILNLKKEIKEQNKLIKHQMKAIDKSLETNKILRHFLEFPQETSNKTTNKNFNDGYKQALLDIKKALHVKYPTEQDINKLLNDLELI